MGLPILLFLATALAEDHSCGNLTCNKMMHCLFSTAPAACDTALDSLYGIELDQLPEVTYQTTLTIHFGTIEEEDLVSDPDKQFACRQGIAQILGVAVHRVEITKIGSQIISSRRVRSLAADDLVVEFVVAAENAADGLDLATKVDTLTASDFETAIKSEALKLGVQDFQVAVTEEPTAKTSTVGEPSPTDPAHNSSDFSVYGLSLPVTVGIAAAVGISVILAAATLVRRSKFLTSTHQEARKSRAITLGMGRTLRNSVEHSNPQHSNPVTRIGAL